MSIRIDPEKFALSVISSTPATGNAPGAIAKTKIEQYIAAYEAADSHNSNKSKHVIDPRDSFGKKNES